MSGFIYTTAIDKLRKLNKRIRGVPGGTSGGKTFGILPILIDGAAKNPGKEISVVSESIPHLRRGALRDFEKIMRSTGRWTQSHYNKALLKYTFANNSHIEFFSTDQPDRLRGARRDILYINEADNVKWEAYQQLAIRTHETIWLDFNPTHEFWYHTELQGDDDFEEQVLTYLDNEATPEAVIKELEKAREKAKTSEYWANWYKVYGLGELGVLEGVIFDNWKTISKLPKEANMIGYGLDFGYTNDPSALIAIYEWNNKRILHEVMYKTGMVNKDIAAAIDAYNAKENHRIMMQLPKEARENYKPRKWTTYADSAEPKSIEEIYRLNHDIRPVTKGADSINFGIQTMQGQDYLVTEESTNLIKELRNYCYDTDKTGKTLNKPVDKYNHGIDAVRYHEMETIGLKRSNFFF